jgi:2-polyprenyl-3-methyl-5-hydroxy-6-metoxy-1,4-benzoquinol methylase
MKEYEIRPKDLLNSYVELSALDAERFFAKAATFSISCVGCGWGETTPQFKKNGFAYAACDNCGTLFQTPRASMQVFENFYRDSTSSRYWAEVFYPAVAEVRREKIFRPRVERLGALCAERKLTVNRLIDVGAGYGVFLDEWRVKFPATQIVAIEPSASLASECRTKGFQVIEDVVENVTDGRASADLVTCFEVLEHAHDPLAFIQSLSSLAKPGGYVFISTLGVDGFDLRILWEKSQQISPPHHINFLSIKGFESLFARAGLVDISVMTPGQLDVDIIRNAVKTDPTLLEGQKFLLNLLNDDRKAEAFQLFLTQQKLSSHVWVIGRKRPIDSGDNDN